MSILEVRKNLRKTLGPRTAYFRPWVRRLERKERPLFFRLARNIRRRSLPKIQAPLRHGFVSIDDAIADREMVRDHVRAAPFAGVRRETRLQEVIDIVHACSANYDVYIGRTYVRPGQEHRGPAARWRDHKTNPKRKARFARVLFRCDRDDIGRNEALAVALIKTWDAHGALCCNVTDRRRPDDPAAAVRQAARGCSVSGFDRLLGARSAGRLPLRLRRVRP